MDAADINEEARRRAAAVLKEKPMTDDVKTARAKALHMAATWGDSSVGKFHVEDAIDAYGRALALAAANDAVEKTICWLDGLEGLGQGESETRELVEEAKIAIGLRAAIESGEL
jgi:hypothetical protein